MSGAAAPSSVPGPGPRKAPGPVVVPRKTRRPRRWALFASGLVAAALIGGAAWVLRNWGEQPGGPAGPVAALPTAAVGFGDVQRTIRVSGVVQAERSAALMAPQLFGGRRGRGRSGVSGGGGSSSSSSAGSASSSPGSSSSFSSSGSSSSSGGSSFSGGSSTSAGSSFGAGSSGSGQSETSSLGPRRGTTNRFQSQSSSRSSTRGSSGRSADTGLGSTGGSLFSFSGGGGGGGGGGMSMVMTGGGGGMGGGGMGGGSEFMLVLTDLIKPGSQVKKGERVAEFDRQYMLLRLDDYRSSLVQHEANIKKLEANLAVNKEAHEQQIRVARANVDKAHLDLKTIEVRSAIESERFKLALEEAQAQHKSYLAQRKLVEVSQRSQVRNAALDRDQAKLELQRAENNAERMVLKAPIDGIVVMQSIRRGGDQAQIQQGDQVPSGMVFMTIVDPSSMIINASVNQVDGEQLRVGMKAIARLDAYPDLRLPATVVGVGAMTRTGGWRANWVREIPIRLKLDKTDPRVLPDLSASAEIILGEERQAAVVPVAAVFRDRGGLPYVWVREPAEGWRRRDVEPALANFVEVAVRSGVRKGELVALERPR